MLFKPNFDRILAKKIEADNKTVGGIEFTRESDVEKARVLSVAKGLENISEIKVGYTIYFEPHTAISLPQENLIVIKEMDVLGFEDNTKGE